jgi:RNA polymerase sigma-70 factor (ECF subfamily)
MEDGTLIKIAYSYAPYHADDLVQMTAIHMLDKTHSYKEGNFVGFLRVMMLRLFLNHKRSNTRALNAREHLVERGSNLTMFEIGGLNPVERRILVKECYAYLDDHERQIWLLLKEGYIHREIADLLDVNINTIHGRVARIKAKLRDLLNQFNKKEEK